VIVVASSNGKVGIGAAMAVLRSGGSALDAVVAGIEPVESNPEDHSVGYGGLPNLIGEVELDASLMDGRTLAAGAVGALKGYEHPIAVARKVLEELPHVLLVGAGAARFAREMGFPERDLLTPAAAAIWRARLEQGAEVDPGTVKYLGRMAELAKLATDPERPNETVNFIARDREGDIACGVSTSGWSWKYPGRLGDSPLIAAGNYADNRHGAAACTGRGEMAIRAATARSVVLYLKMGLPLEAALREAMTDLHAVEDAYAGGMNVVALDRDGTPAAASNRQGATYIVMRDDMADYEERERLYVP
jgi:beta-aspartyl-peptidase (threonine type)